MAWSLYFSDTFAGRATHFLIMAKHDVQLCNNEPINGRLEGTSSPSTIEVLLAN